MDLTFSNVYLNKTPTQSDLDYIESWLQKEYRTYGEGFYSNWHLILESLNKKQLAVFKVDNKAIGFLSWYDGKIQRNIEIMVLQPKFRKRGFGRIFFQEFEEFSRNQGFSVLLLYCSPEESQFFWKKVGFIDVHKASSIYHHLSLYKPMINRLETTQCNSLNKLELWDEDPYKLTTETAPKWTWDLSKLSSSISILEACSYEWNLKLTLGGKIIDENKVKYFKKGRTHFGSFLYINYNDIWKPADQ